MSFLQSIPFHLISCSSKRLALVQPMLDKIKLQYTVHSFARHPTNPVRGAYESHMSLFRYAKENDLPWIAILEDNIRLASDDSNEPPLPSDEQYQFMKDRLMEKNSKDDWEVIIFGGFTFLISPFALTSDSNVLSTRGTCHGASGYVISKAGYLRMLELDRQNIDMPIDFLMQESEHAAPEKVLVMTPMVFLRDTRIGSIVTPFHDYWRPFVFSPPVQRKLLSCGKWCAEHYYRPHPLTACFVSWALLVFVVVSLLKLFYYVCSRIIVNVVRLSTMKKKIQRDESLTS